MLKIHNSKAYKLIVLLSITFSMILVWLLKPVCVYATEAEDRLDGMIIIEEYSITNDKIVPGEDFTLTIKVTNCSNHSLSSVLISVTNPNGVVPKYGTITQQMLTNFQARESREISFEYTASNSLEAESIDFSIALDSSTNTNKVVLRIPVGNERPIQIASVSIPDHATSGEVIVAYLNLQTVGNSNVDDVVVSVESMDTVLGSSSIGTITAGASKTQGISFTLNDAGTQYVDLCLSYRDDNGINEKLVIKSVQIDVSSVSAVSSVTEVAPVEVQVDNTNQIIISVCLILLLLVFIAIAVILRRNRR